MNKSTNQTKYQKPTHQTQPIKVRHYKTICDFIDYLENAILSKMSKRANNHSMGKFNPLMSSFQISLYIYFLKIIFIAY